MNKNEWHFQLLRVICEECDMQPQEIKYLGRLNPNEWYECGYTPEKMINVIHETAFKKYEIKYLLINGKLEEKNYTFYSKDDIRSFNENEKVIKESETKTYLKKEEINLNEV